jgi:hypothetical protein
MSWLVADQIAELLDMHRDAQPPERRKAYDKMSNTIMQAVYDYMDIEKEVDNEASKE